MKLKPMLSVLCCLLCAPHSFLDTVQHVTSV
jgi:hypothetical protein